MIKALNEEECQQLKEEFWDFFKNGGIVYQKKDGVRHGRKFGGFFKKLEKDLKDNDLFNNEIVDKISNEYNLNGYNADQKFEKVIKILALANYEEMNRIIRVLKNANTIDLKEYFKVQYKDNFRPSKFAKEKLFKYFPTCPYCNFTYLPRLTEDYFALQIDHHFPISVYPYLGISIFNLVPSCTACNHLKKDNSEDLILYPYLEEFGSAAKFKININNLMNYSKDIIEIEINAQKDLKNRIENSIDIFKIGDKYKSLTIEAKEIYYKYLATNDSQIEELFQNFQKLSGSKKEIKEIYYGTNFDDKNYIKRPLSKFINDLINDLEKN